MLTDWGYCRARSPAVPLEVPSEPRRFNLKDDASSFTYGDFFASFANGVPIVVSGIEPGDDNFSPSYFINNFGDEKVNVIDTVTNVPLPRRMTVREYLEGFLDGRKSEVLGKLKVGNP